MLKEMPLLRAPENKRTGMEIKPNVKYPDQTDAAIRSPRIEKGARAAPSVESLAHVRSFWMHQPLGSNREKKHDGVGMLQL
jgi:hypothetical protein